MKKLIYFALFMAAAMLLSCTEDTEKDYSVKGNVQKGPFIKGSELMLYELDAKMVQTGKSFSSEILTDLGAFDFGNIKLRSSMVEISANGYYFNERNGFLSESPLFLKAIVDVTDKESITVNILTHLATDRIKKLIAEGKSFEEANSQSKTELLAYFKAESLNKNNLENFNLNGTDDKTKFLLAVSAIFQQSYQTALISKLIADFKSDLADNGIINDGGLTATLQNNAQNVNIVQVRANLQKLYDAQGLQVSVPDFSNFITGFAQGTTVAALVFPNTVAYGANLLNLAAGTDVKTQGTFSVTVQFPTEVQYEVRLKMNAVGTGTFWTTGESTNWTGDFASGNEISATGKGITADKRINFTTPGKVQLQMSIFKVGVTNEYISSKNIDITVY